ncbi:MULTISPECIES: hypothetical protein [unclassified Thermotoga]|uniref:hypothetical protein n=1 Tax=unclassified Thermotoga TaxID=2631113 RepID=UPI000305B645|nr:MULTISPECIES: hypothetical protein [unclassified Thermotoga]
MLGYFIEEAKFQLKEVKGNFIDYQLELETEFEEIVRQGNSFFRSIILGVHIEGKQENVQVHDIYVRIKGNFEADLKESEKDLFDNLCRYNGLMNLLVIARSFIATTTAQMGIHPILIPMVDLTKVEIKN